MAGTCFIVPAFLIVLAAALLYVRYGSTPQAQGRWLSWTVAGTFRATISVRSATARAGCLIARRPQRADWRKPIASVPRAARRGTASDRMASGFARALRPCAAGRATTARSMPRILLSTREGGHDGTSGAGGAILGPRGVADRPRGRTKGRRDTVAEALRFSCRGGTPGEWRGGPRKPRKSPATPAPCAWRAISSGPSPRLSV